MLQSTGTICTAAVQFNFNDSYSINGDFLNDQWQFVPSNYSGVVLNALYSVTLTARNTGGSDNNIITLSTYVYLCLELAHVYDKYLLICI